MQFRLAFAFAFFFPCITRVHFGFEIPDPFCLVFLPDVGSVIQWGQFVAVRIFRRPAAVITTFIPVVIFFLVSLGQNPSGICDQNCRFLCWTAMIFRYLGINRITCRIAISASPAAGLVRQPSAVWEFRAWPDCGLVVFRTNRPGVFARFHSRYSVSRSTRTFSGRLNHRRCCLRICTMSP